MLNDLQEPVRRQVGGSLDRLPVLKRLEKLRQSAVRLRGDQRARLQADGHPVRKIVGAPR